MKQVWKKSLVLLGVLSGIAVGAQNQGELFKADFDNYNVTAGYAKGSPKSISFTNPDLQLRMFPGAGDGKKNGICLENSEYVSYDLKDNFNTKQGTVSLWVSPQNWKVSDNYTQVFFTANYYGKDEFFSFLLYKTNKKIAFYYGYKSVNPKQNKNLVAAFAATDKAWFKNSWHKLDAVWNDKGLSLYIDGKIAAERKFHPNEAIVLPDCNQGLMMLGTKFKWKDMNMSSLTGYDDLVIYSRCLSAQEIRKGFEKYYPNQDKGTMKENPTVTMPELTQKIVLDGRIDEKEWSDAAKVAIDRPFCKNINRQTSKYAWAWIKYDSENFYIAMKSDRPAAKAEATERDSKVYMDDCFEIHFAPDNVNRIYQYVLNANNAIFDEHQNRVGVNEDKKWNGNLRTAVFKNDQFWSAEFIIPIKDNGLKVGDKFYLNFAYLNNAKDFNQFSWSLLQPECLFGTPKTAGTALWGKKGDGVRLEGFGDTARGRMTLNVKAVDPAKTSKITTTAQLMLDGTVTPVKSGNITGNPWTRVLPTGKHRLQWESKEGDRVIAAGFHAFEIDKPLEVSFECHGERHYVDVLINFNNAGENVLKELYKSGIHGSVSLVDANKKIVSQEKLQFKAAEKTVRLKLPEDIKTGLYQLQVKLNGTEKLSVSLDFRVPDMTPYKLRVAVDNTVPTPWTKVESAGNGKWKVLNRTFTFGKGPMPISIINEGTEMFDVAPSYRIVTESGLQKIQWNDFKVGKNYGDHVEFSGKGLSKDLKFHWKGELWFDGTYKWRLEYSPVKVPVKIQSFKLDWTMPAEFSKYVLHPLFEPWGKDNTIRLNWATVPEENTMCQILGIRKGISWWNESDANWVNHKEEKQITIRKDASGKANVDIAMITIPSELGKTAWYTMTLTATPQRPLNKVSRDFEFYGKDATYGWQREFRMRSDNCHLPLDPEKFRKGLHDTVKRGSKITLYSCPFYLDTWEDHHAYFFHDWKKVPMYMWGTFDYANGDEPIFAQSVCSGSRMFDIYAYREEQIFKNYPELGGLYFDCCHCPECRNEGHGCGGIDAFGQKFSTNTAWKLRECLIRTLKICRKYNRNYLLHGHNKCNPIAHGFGDIWWPGEEYTTYPNGMSPVFIYCDMQDEWLQSAYNSGIRGNCIVILPEPGRAKEYVPNLEERLAKDGGWELSAWAHMTPFLLHDTNLCWVHLKHIELIKKWWKIKTDIKIKDAEFVGYWFRKVLTTDAPRVYASWYYWEKGSDAPYSRLIIIGNLNRTAKKFKLNIDRKAFGIEGKNVEFFDLWNNRPMKEEEFQNLSLDAAHFMAIGVKEK